MPTTVKTVKTVDVTLTDSQGYDTTYKINNPIEDISLGAIQEAYRPVIEGGYLYSKAGYPYTAVVRATVNEVVTTTTPLESE